MKWVSDSATNPEWQAKAKLQQYENGLAAAYIHMEAIRTPASNTGNVDILQIIDRWEYVTETAYRYLKDSN